jgi:Putative restriction endonuclease
MTATRQLAETPNDGFERWLMRGQLRTSADRFHTRDQGKLTAKLPYWASGWCDRNPDRGLRVYSCAHCRLGRDPDTVVLAHVAVARPDAWVMVRGQEPEVIEGPPALLVDIVDVRDDATLVAEREGYYVTISNALVWVVDPGTRQAVVYENGKPRLISVTHGGTLSGTSLPGLELDIRRLFGDEHVTESEPATDTVSVR